MKLTEAHAPEPACCWLKTTDTTEGGGYADTPRYVAANAKNGAPSSNQSSLSTGRTSGGLLGIIGVNGLPEDGVTAIIAANQRQKQVLIKPNIYRHCIKRHITISFILV
ncbi:hypothetical protein XENOCAPTIV_028607 [Xenoophorus captivus]|uniref:Uncharacterized protein n=1 Tax=Xenoophorus captivus TaxID=1517983 RepID=A0ABV0RSB2_9TELE